jgi:hypothetical protein
VNVFVLTAGRSGSHTIAYAFSHATNYTVGLEYLDRRMGKDRFAYPDNHIEVDCRLTWMLGRLDEAYGKDAYYIHLRRNREDTARSHTIKFSERKGIGALIASHYIVGVARLASKDSPANAYMGSLDYVDNVTANIRHFLKDKPHQREVWLEELDKDFPTLWREIGAEGDLSAALEECRTKHSTTENPGGTKNDRILTRHSKE